MKTTIFTTCRRVALLSAVVCVLGLGATSCSQYDDSGLKNSISQLEDRVDALEAKLTQDIEALQSMLSGKMTVVSCVLENNVYTITLSDGTTVTVDKAGSTTDYPVITYIEEDGVRYWAVVRDGQTEALLADGKKVPVASMPKVRIEPSTDEYQVSIDGGKTWEGLGVYAKNDSEDVALFKAVDQDENYVYLTLSDDKVVKVLKETDLKCVAMAGKQYFQAGETKTIKLQLGGVEKTTVTKPDGWKASVSGTSLSITAPVAENPYAETKGTVAVVAVGGNGQSTITEVSVVIGTAPVTVTIDTEAMTASFVMDPSLVDSWDFMGYLYGATKADEFVPEQMIESIVNNPRLTAEFESIENKPIEDMLGYAPEKGVSYVVWAIPAVGYGETYNPADFVYEVAASTNIAMTVVSKNFEDAELLIVPAGCDRYYGGVLEKGDEYLTLDYVIEGINDWGEGVIVNGTYEGMLSNYATAWGTNDLQSGKTYIVYAIPYAPGKTYTVDDAFTMEVEVDAIVAGGSATVTFGDVTADITSVAVTITPSDDTYKAYAAYLNEADYAAYSASDDDLRQYLLESGRTFTETYEHTQSFLDPETKGYFVAVAVDAEGKAGKCVVKECVTKAIEYSDALSVAVEAVEIGADKVTLKLTPTGDIVKYRYVNITKANWQNHYLFQGDEALTESALATKSTYEVYEMDAAELTDGTMELTYLEMNKPYYFFVMGVDAEGNISHMTRFEYKPQLDITFVRKSKPEWAASSARPVISDMTIDGTPVDELTDYSPGFHVLSFTATPGTDCEEFYVLVQDPSYLGNDFYTRSTYVIANGTTYPGTEAATVTNEYFSFDSGEYIGSRVFIVWKDTAGKYYEADEINPAPVPGM